MNPIDYRLQNTSPVQAGFQGLAAGMQFEQQQQAVDEAENQRMAAKAMQEDLAAFAAKGDKKPNDYIAMMNKYPSLSEQFQKTYQIAGEAKRETSRKDALRVYGLLHAGQSDLAIEALEEKKQAALNSGATEDANIADAMIKIIKINPDTAKASAGMFLAGTMPEKEFADAMEKIGGEARADIKIPYEVKKIASDIGLTEAQTNKAIIDAKKTEAEIAKTNAEAGKVAIEAAKLQMEMKNQAPVKLSNQAEKIMNDAVVQATNSMNLSRQYENTAEEFRDVATLAGIAGKGEEAVKTFFGDQDKITMLRQEFKRLKNSAVINMLPPGPATDKDIEIIASGFPNETADPIHLADFMETMARVQRYESGMNNMKAEWVQKVGSLGSPREELIINGIDVPAGSRFSDFVKSNVSSPVKEGSGSQPSEEGPQEVGQVNKKRYMDY